VSSNNYQRGPPKPPAKGRPSPPKKGRPLPPKTGNVVDPERKADSVREKAKSLEIAGEFSQAAIFYRSAGLVDDENRCLQLALSKSEANKVTNIHNGDKIIRDSVIMDNENQ